MGLGVKHNHMFKVHIQNFPPKNKENFGHCVSKAWANLLSLCKVLSIAKSLFSGPCQVFSWP